MAFPKVIQYEGKNYYLLRKRVYMSVAIYRSDCEQLFLRMGEPALIQQEFALHTQLLKYTFPVPELGDLKEYGEMLLYTETSMGSKLLSFHFADEIAEQGAISNQTWEAFLSMLGTYVHSQLRTVENRGRRPLLVEETFQSMIDECPELSEQLLTAKKLYYQHTDSLPYVFSHGDFNTHNTFISGVIDVEGYHYLPFGYDVMTMLYNNHCFPIGEQYEMNRLFMFTPQQLEEASSTVDEIAMQYGISHHKEYIDDHVLLRVLYTAKRMQKWPYIRTWRLDLTKKTLDAYLTGKSVVDVVQQYSA